VGLLALGGLVVAIGLVVASDHGLDVARAANQPSVWTAGRVRVEVLNGGGVSGMAGAATEVLRTSGFDVVHFGNAADFDPERPSVVIDRVGRTDLAQAVAAALGIDNVQSEPDPNLYVDVTVVIGQAWVSEPRSGSDPSIDQRPRWDPRTWFGS